MFRFSCRSRVANLFFFFFFSRFVSAALTQRTRSRSSFRKASSAGVKQKVYQQKDLRFLEERLNNRSFIKHSPSSDISSYGKSSTFHNGLNPSTFTPSSPLSLQNSQTLPLPPFAFVAVGSTTYLLVIRQLGCCLLTIIRRPLLLLLQTIPARFLQSAPNTP